MYTANNNVRPKGIPICVAAAYWTKESIKELANFYYQQATLEKESPKNIGNIRKDFKPFMEYKIINPIDQAIQLSLPFPSVS